MALITSANHEASFVLRYNIHFLRWLSVDINPSKKTWIDYVRLFFNRLLQSIGIVNIIHSLVTNPYHLPNIFMGGFGVCSLICSFSLVSHKENILSKITGLTKSFDIETLARFRRNDRMIGYAFWIITITANFVMTSYSLIHGNFELLKIQTQLDVDYHSQECK